jgi:succinate dehydrogenase / fumarate reductase membrane anchor subunit
MTMRTPLRRARGLGSAKDGTEHFMRQRLTALANIPLILFFVLLVIGLSGADHATFVATVSSPIVAILLMLVIVSATIHMRIGMQVVIEDYIHDEIGKMLALAANTFFAIFIAVAAIFAIAKISFAGAF